MARRPIAGKITVEDHRLAFLDEENIIDEPVQYSLRLEICDFATFVFFLAH
jgi:hypothetical protein